MLRLTRILGQATDAALFERLHRCEHDGTLERIVLGAEEAQRHRLRVSTDRGTDCAIALPRDQKLGNGTVLLLQEDRAIVAVLREEEVLRFAPADAAAALQLGYFAGNMHWAVRFDGPELTIILNGPADSYLARLEPMLSTGRIVQARQR